MKPHHICKGRASVLLPFMAYTYELAFAAEPDYDFLLDMLHKIVRNKGKRVDHVFDW